MLEASELSIRADQETDASAKVSMLLECLHERQIDLTEMSQVKRLKLEQRIHLLQLENQANQVINWIRNGESMLAASFAVPSSLAEANELSHNNQQVQVRI